METLFVASILGSISALATLLAIWLALGGGTAIWRAILAIAGVSVAALLFCAATGEGEAEWLVLLWVVAASVAALLLPVRLCGYRLTKPGGSRRRPGEMQFSIRQLLALTAVVAAVAGATRLLAPIAPTTSAIGFALAVALCLGVVALVAVWATLGLDLTHTKTATLVIVAALMAGLTYYGMEATNADPGPIWGGAVIVFAMALTGALLVVRARGFRLVCTADPAQHGTGGTASRGDAAAAGHHEANA